MTGWLLKPLRLMPSSRRASTAATLAGEPLGALTPAESMVMSFLLPTRDLMSPSAIGLRQMFPVQTKRIVFFPEPPSCFLELMGIHHKG